MKLNNIGGGGGGGGGILISSFGENGCIITRDRMSQMGHYFVHFSIRRSLKKC